MQRPCGRSVPNILEKQKEAFVAGAEYVGGRGARVEKMKSGR